MVRSAIRPRPARPSRNCGRWCEKYPNSPLKPEAEKHLREARDRLSDAEYRVAYFYVKTQKFPPAAIDRFKSLLKDDPEYSRRDAVYFYLAQSLMKVNRGAEALPIWNG